ncbi:5'-nucleotidase [Geomonas terrae]|uniref:5'-nucleotidase n=1 Tax=Geomonas terrae TaxID=2562681 RepID=A0A4S1CBH9_9BACT|nr:5'-nucleotidase [Geomonas terrae]TGU70714.1 5'-nucleotidase [Geomonas terrae]
MPYDLEHRLVIGLASSALFDLSESDTIYRTEGPESYRKFQRENQGVPLKQGVAFPFIKRLLSLNELDLVNPPIEVVLMSRNSPDTGLRVMNSIAHYELGMTRAVFLQGRSPHKYIPALNISLFLSANELDVRQAILAGYPAGQVLDSRIVDNVEDKELRIAFDFDGVLADDEAEAVYQKTHDLNEFHQHETDKAHIAHNPGPLKVFLEKISVIQQMEEERASTDVSYVPKLRISIVTARSAPSHERVINTMRTWNINVDEAFFLGGIEKKKVLEVLDPHIFFDDQKLHLEPAASVLPSVHIPFGITNVSIE